VLINQIKAEVLMAKNSQMLKGVLEGCILHLINNEEIYGYRICEKLDDMGFDDVDNSSIYPILIRLEKKKYIYALKKNSSLGPKRKYYYLSPLGEEMLAKFEQDWFAMQIKVANLLSGKEYNK
jgi:PadR family transcriptional regulator, regulatory protein PadR